MLSAEGLWKGEKLRTASQQEGEKNKEKGEDLLNILKHT